MKLLRRLTYSRPLTRAARFLGLTGMLRRLYYRWAGPADGVIRLKLAGIDASFYAETPVEFRNLECPSAGGEERPLSVLMSSLGEGDTFYDIGSNVGLYSIPVAKVVGMNGGVVAFEPGRSCYERFQANVKLNELTNVRAFRKALGDANGNGSLLVEGPLNMQSRLVNLSTETVPGTEPVEVVRGDDFCVSESLPVPRAAKIDVEGSEFAVIKGLANVLGDPRCKLLCCEIHIGHLPTPLQPEDIVELIKSLGFNRIYSYPRNGEIHLITRKGSNGHGQG